jgi:hypothetical protein
MTLTLKAKARMAVSAVLLNRRTMKAPQTTQNQCSMTFPGWTRPFQTGPLTVPELDTAWFLCPTSSLYLVDVERKLVCNCVTVLPPRCNSSKHYSQGTSVAYSSLLLTVTQERIIEADGKM